MKKKMAIRTGCDSKWKLNREHELGHGEQGVVYEGCLKENERDCRYAIKEMEAKGGMAAAVKYAYFSRFPFFPKVYDIWMCEGKILIVMERICGLTLRRYKTNLIEKYGPRKADEILRPYWLQVDKYKETLHRIGFVHTDIHAGNVMLDRGVPRLVDLDSIDWIRAPPGFNWEDIHTAKELEEWIAPEGHSLVKKYSL